MLFLTGKLEKWCPRESQRNLKSRKNHAKMTSRTRVPKRHEKILKTMGPNLAGRHSRSNPSACQQKSRGYGNHPKGYQNPSKIHPKSRKSGPGRRLRNHLKLVVRFLRKIMKNDFQMESQRAPEGPPLGEIRGAEGRSGPGPLQDLQNGAQKAGF